MTSLSSEKLNGGYQQLVELLISGKLTGENANWEKILKLSRRFYLSQLIYPSIEQLELATTIKQEFLNDRRSTFLANFHHLQNLKILAASFAEQKLKMLALKGAVLLLQYYHDPADRLLADLDILIEAKQLRVADKLLTNLKFKAVKNNCAFNHWVVNNLTHWNYYSQNARLLELHWSLRGRSSSLNCQKMFSKATTITYQEQQLLIPSANDLALHLILHALDQHSYQPTLQLKTAVDLTMMIRQEKNNLSYSALKENFSQYLNAQVLDQYLAFLARIYPSQELTKFCPKLVAREYLQFFTPFEQALEDNWRQPQEESSLTLEAVAREKSFFKSISLIRQIVLPNPGKLSYLHNLSITDLRLWWQYFLRPLYLVKKFNFKLFKQALLTGKEKQKWQER